MLYNFKPVRLILTLILLCSLAYGQVKPEILSFSKSKLNDSIPSALTKQKLLRFLGKPTKIEKFETECALTEEQEQAKMKQWYWYDSTKFFVYDNLAELTEINFRSKRFIYKTNTLTLSGNTTFQDIQKVYPINTSAALKENGGKLVRIKPCKECDGYCFLYFENKILVKLLWYEDC